MTTEELACLIGVPLGFIAYYCLLLVIDFLTGKRPQPKNKP